MLLPSKLTSYHESTLSKLAPILFVLEKRDMHVVSLYETVRNKMDGIENFIMALDCLYALGKIEYDENERIVSYVGKIG